jgi:phosphate/sulfate permease
MENIIGAAEEDLIEGRARQPLQVALTVMSALSLMLEAWRVIRTLGVQMGSVQPLEYYFMHVSQARSR